MMNFTDALASIPADHILSVVDTWLWEARDPANRPSAVEAAVAIDIMTDRLDAHDAHVQAAIGKCLDYLG